MKICKKNHNEYQRIYENLANDEVGKWSSRNININNETRVGLPNILINEDTDFVSIKKVDCFRLQYKHSKWNLFFWIFISIVLWKC